MVRSVELLYSEPHADRPTATKRERQLKGWSRAKKLALIAGDFGHLKQLARSRSQSCAD